MQHILGRKVTFDDMEAIDPDYYKSLLWILENDITGVLDDLTFSTEADVFGKLEVVDLKANGRNIPVTEENKLDYVRLVSESRMTTSIKAQISAFLEGLRELIPHSLISIFNEQEIELLTCGLPDIDVDDLYANTEYSGYTLSSQQIQWFWECVRAMDAEKKARLIQFVTGTSKIPLEGFGALQGMNGPQKFQIHRAYGGVDRLPSAHTCFNQLDIPEYTAKEQMKERLELAIREAHDGFGFG